MEEKLIQQEQLLEFHPKTSFTVISKGQVVSIGYDEITHISKYGNETTIYTLVSSYRTSHSLQEIMNDLPVNDFFRIHKSHVISLRCMNGVARGRIRIGEYYLPLSNYYKAQLITSLKEKINRLY